MRLLVKYPTRGRPEKALEVLGKYVAMESGDHDVHYVVVCDSNDTTMHVSWIEGQLARMQRVSAFWGDHPDKVTACNAFTPDPKTWDVIILASDDMVPQIQGWDAAICDAMMEHYPDLDGVIWFNDGIQGKLLNTLSIMGRVYYERFGYVYYPGYKSLCCDNEFMYVSQALGKVTFIDRVVIRHEHWLNHFRAADKSDYAGVENHPHDWALLTQRQIDGFELAKAGG